MRKAQFWIALWALVGCMACNRTTPSEASSPQDSIPIADMLSESPTTALPEDPLRKLPAGYVLDSVLATDSATSYRTTLYFPQSVTDTVLNELILAYCETAAAYHAPDPADKVDDSQFAMWPIAVAQQGDLLSILFQDQSYYSHAAHFTHGYDGLNIDLPTRAEITFTDLIRFIGQKPRLAFCELVEGQNPDAPRALSPEDLRTDLDFAISEGKLSLCFDDFDLGPSQAILSVPVAGVQGFLTARAIKILRL